MPTIRRSLRMTRKMIASWTSFFNEEQIESNYMCPDFYKHMTTCVEELLCYTDSVSVFTYIQPILATHAIEDVVGAAYWFTKQHLRHLDRRTIPSTIHRHPWVGLHLVTLRDRYERHRLLMEREHVKEIATWTEMSFIPSQTRKLIRKIDVELKMLDE